MSIITIILFFVYTYCLGFTLTSFVKQPLDFFERHLMRIGIGLASIPLLISIITWINVPIDWRIILLVSVLVSDLLVDKKCQINKIQEFRIAHNNKSNIVFLLLISHLHCSPMSREHSSIRGWKMMILGRMAEA